MKSYRLTARPGETLQMEDVLAMLERWRADMFADAVRKMKTGLAMDPVVDPDDADRIVAEMMARFHCATPAWRDAVRARIINWVECVTRSPRSS